MSDNSTNVEPGKGAADLPAAATEEMALEELDAVRGGFVWPKTAAGVSGGL